MAAIPATAASAPGRGLSPIWGPFSGPGDALNHVGPYIDRTLDASVGLCWVGGGALYPLRKPHYDANGFGEIAVVEWRTLPPPPPKPHAPSGFWERVRAALDAYFEQQGEQALMQSRIAMAQSQMINNVFSSLYRRAFSDKHAADTEGVILDAVAVGLTIGFVTGGLGWIAMGGALVLLALDGAAWGTEMAGDDESAEWIKDKTKPARWIAIAASVPDAAWGVFKAVRELPEVGRTVAEMRAGRAASTSTAARATANAERATGEAASASLDAAAQARKAEFARRYREIAQRAQQRAAAKAQKLGAAWAKVGSLALHEMTPRFTVPESIRLMYGDLTPKDKEEAAAFLQRYVFSLVSVHR